MNLSYENILSGVEYNLVSSEGLSRVYEVKIDHSKFADLMSDFFVETQKTYTTKYFNRAGKVPLSIVKNDFAQKAFSHVVSSVASKVLEKLDEKFLGEPNVSVTEYYDEKDSSKNPSITLTLNKEPEVPEIDFKEVSIIDPQVEVSDEDVENEMKAWADNNERGVELSEKRSAKMGDTLVISMSLLDKSKGAADKQSFNVKLGAGMFVKEIEDKLVGKNEGEKVPHTVTVPKDAATNKNFPSDMKRFAGKDLAVNLIVEKIMETKNYEVDVEMAKKFGCSSVERCKAHFRSMMEKKVNDSAFMYKKHQLSKILDEKLNFEVPVSALKIETQAFWNRFLAKFNLTRETMFNYDEIKMLFTSIQSAGYLKDKTFEDIDNHYLAVASRRLKFFFVMKEIQGKFNVALTKEDLDQEIMNRSSDFKGGLAEAVNHYEKNKSAQRDLENIVLEDKIVNEVLLKISIKSEKMDVQSLFNKLSEIVKELDIKIENPVDSEEIEGKSESAEKVESSDSESTSKVKKVTAKKVAKKPVAKKTTKKSEKE